MSDIDDMLSGKLRPPNIPDEWEGEPLPGNQGWRWFNPDNRGDSVRIYASDEPYVVVTRNGQIIGRDGKPTGEELHD